MILSKCTTCNGKGLIDNKNLCGECNGSGELVFENETKVNEHLKGQVEQFTQQLENGWTHIAIRKNITDRLHNPDKKRGKFWKLFKIK